MSASDQPGTEIYRDETLCLKHLWISEHFSLPPKVGAVTGNYVLYCKDKKQCRFCSPGHLHLTQKNTSLAPIVILFATQTVSARFDFKEVLRCGINDITASNITGNIRTL